MGPRLFACKCERVCLEGIIFFIGFLSLYILILKRVISAFLYSSDNQEHFSQEQLDRLFQVQKQKRNFIFFFLFPHEHLDSETYQERNCRFSQTVLFIEECVIIEIFD